MSSIDRVIQTIKDLGGSSTAEPIAQILDATPRGVRGYLLILTRSGVLKKDEKVKPTVWTLPEEPGTHLTRSQRLALDVIARHPDCMIVDIVKSTGQYRDSVLGTVARLEQAGYVVSRQVSKVKYLTAIAEPEELITIELEEEIQEMPEHTRCGLPIEDYRRARADGLSSSEIALLTAKSFDDLPQFMVRR